MSQKKILIIDDEPDVAVYLETILSTNNYRAYASYDIKSAMEQVENIRPDLICLDIMMPQETGFSFYKRLRQKKEYDSIPVIIISGAIDNGEFEFRKYVSDESIIPPEFYLEKPVVVDDYLEKIKSLLN